MTELLWLMTLLLATRMIYLVRDRPLGSLGNVVVALVQLAGLFTFFAWGPAAWLASVTDPVTGRAGYMSRERDPIGTASSASSSQ